MFLSSSLFCRRRHPYPNAPGLALCFMAAALTLLPPAAGAKAGRACLMLKAGQAKTRVRVKLSARQPEKAYCIRAQKGQLLAAKIANAQGVQPSGRVISPAGEMNGGPGGPFYRGVCRKSGIYRIRVGQRGRKRAGSYDLLIEITPPR
jgi:hypothetical protein